MRTIYIGLLGFGTVGAGVFEIIQRRRTDWIERYGLQPVVKTILVKNPDKPRSIDFAPTQLTTDPDAILSDPEIEIVIEVVGGERPALHYARTALTRGKHLVTANKLMLALHGPELFRLACEHRVELGFEGSVGGGIPIIQPIRESLNANEIQSLFGVINGTTNYILTAMSQDNEGYFDVLARAQALGYAEADPSSDVDGWDTCYKLSVLTGISFGQQLPVDRIHTEGIADISLADIAMAKALGYQVKLTAKAERTADGIVGRVHPTLLPADHPLAGVRGVNNALLVNGDAVGEVVFYGSGAGMMATGSAVASDLIRISRQIADQSASAAEGSPFRHRDRLPVFASPGSRPHNKGYFFITLQSVTPPDLDSVRSILTQNRIALESVLTKDDANLYYLGIITGLSAEEDLQAARKKLSADPKYRKIFYYYLERSADGSKNNKYR